MEMEGVVVMGTGGGGDGEGGDGRDGDGGMVVSVSGSCVMWLDVNEMDERVMCNKMCMYSGEL